MKPIYWIIIIGLIAVTGMALYLRSKGKKQGCGETKLEATMAGVPLCKSNTGSSPVNPATMRQLENECEIQFNTDQEVQACVQQKIDEMS